MLKTTELFSNMNGEFNVVKIDSKGRIIIPFHIRDYFGLREGTELLILINNERKELRIMPLLENASRISTAIDDSPGSLSKVLEVLAKNSMDIVTSMSRTVEKGRLAEWDAIVDVSACKDVKKVENELKKLDVIKKVRFERWEMEK